MASAAFPLHFADDDRGAWQRARALRSDDHQPWRHRIQAPVSRKFPNAGSRLQPQAQQYVDANISDRFEQTASPSPHQSGAESAVPQLAKSTHEIRERLHNALRNRIGIGKPVSVKVVARATGLTERTIENAMSGETMPRGDTLMALIDFFDASFANEIFAGSTFMVVKLSDERAAHAARQINDGLRVLAELQRRA